MRAHPANAKLHKLHGDALTAVGDAQVRLPQTTLVVYCPCLLYIARAGWMSWKGCKRELLAWRILFLA